MKKTPNTEGKPEHYNVSAVVDDANGQLLAVVNLKKNYLKDMF